jgi:hypothetical protein
MDTSLLVLQTPFVMKNQNVLILVSGLAGKAVFGFQKA